MGEEVQEGAGGERNGTEREVQSSREKQEQRGQSGTDHCSRRANKARTKQLGARERQGRGPEHRKEKKREYFWMGEVKGRQKGCAR
jgi:hypothetical protein